MSDEALPIGTKNLLRNYSCLAAYFKAMLSQAEKEQFKAWYPRTWNALETNDATTFDLPAPDSKELNPDD